MSNSETDIKQIRNNIIKGVTCQFLPFLLIGLFESQIESTPLIEALFSILGLIALILLGYGYLVCAEAAAQYAAYKGYRNIYYIYSISNIFGLSLLFLLRNKNLDEYHNTDKNPIERFSIASIFTSLIAIVLVTMPLYYIPGLITMGLEFVEYAKNDRDFNAFTNFIIFALFIWYFFSEMKSVNLDRKTIFGSFKKLNWKLPIGLAIVEYFFAWGINAITLYGLSFLFPEYLNSLFNKEYPTTTIGFIFAAISSLIYAPIIEELFFRGLIFQKIAIKHNIFKAVLVSAIAFSVLHFRFDLIPLFISGIVAAILYFKTKTLATPIINHFSYNLIVISRRLYFQIFPATDNTQPTVLEYQQYVREHFGIYALFLAISIPYLTYFIYKNFPRNRDIDKLPYFVNQ